MKIELKPTSKYFGHFKIHNTLMNAILEGRSMEVVREVDNVTSEKITSRHRRKIVSQSVQEG